MCALAPFPIPNWSSINPIGYEDNYTYGDINESIESLLFQFPAPTKEEILLDSQQSPTAFTQTSSDPSMVKKLNHNASERDRRKKINNLYSSLRSLLPATSQMKKLSFPAIVSHAVKYIPELQEEVESLVQKQEELLLRISQQAGDLKRRELEEKRKSKSTKTSLSPASASISINRLSDIEVVIQISMLNKANRKSPLSQMLHLLEEEGFVLLNVSSFESFEGIIIFYNIHLQVKLETAYKVMESDHEALRDKLLSTMSDNKEDPFAVLY